MPRIFPDGDPYCELVGPPGSVWLGTSEVADLHLAIADLYDGMHPYANRVQAQTLHGMYLTVERELYNSQHDYPSADVASAPVRGELDPYRYAVASHKPKALYASSMLIQQTSDGAAIVSGMHTANASGGAVTGILNEQGVAELTSTLLADTRQAIPNTSELASALTWSELQGAQALVFQNFVGALMECADVTPADLQTCMLQATPRRTSPMPWMLRHLIVGRSHEPEPRIRGTQLNALATLATNHVIISASVYDGQRPVAVTLRHSFGNGKRRFVTTEQRAMANKALAYQLNPPNVELEIIPN